MKAINHWEEVNTTPHVNLRVSNVPHNKPS